jgi:hypothetical protein
MQLTERESWKLLSAGIVTATAANAGLFPSVTSLSVFGAASLALGTWFAADRLAGRSRLGNSWAYQQNLEWLLRPGALGQDPPLNSVELPKSKLGDDQLEQRAYSIPAPRLGSSADLAWLLAFPTILSGSRGRVACVAAMETEGEQMNALLAASLPRERFDAIDAARSEQVQGIDLGKVPSTKKVPKRDERLGELFSFAGNPVGSARSVSIAKVREVLRQIVNGKTGLLSYCSFEADTFKGSFSSEGLFGVRFVTDEARASALRTLSESSTMLACDGWRLTQFHER